MNYQQLDKIADLCNPLMIVALIFLAFRLRPRGSWDFLLRSGLAVIVVQQLSKYAQKKEFWGEDFPSTHFAVAIALSVGLVVLKRQLWPFAIAFLVSYGALMLYIHQLDVSKYHTSAQMLGSFFALPIALLFHYRGKKAQPLAN